jgi:uncharacterized protein YbjT (DUF2867 family)
MSKTFLITSASGSQGGSTARELLKQGHKIHALVRDSSSAAAIALQTHGAILFKGDFNDAPSIAAAIEGVDGVFLNTFPDFKDPDGEVRQAQNIVNAAKATKTVKTVVVSTVHKAAESAELTAPKPEYPFLKYYYARKAGVERVVMEAGFENWTVLRPDCGCWARIFFHILLDYFMFLPRDDVPRVLRQSRSSTC